MSSRNKNSLIHFSNLNSTDIYSIFDTARQFSLVPQIDLIAKNKGRTAALVFFESSTRTRMSFESACARLGIYPMLFDIKSGSSLEKGESFEDTILNIAAMQPDLMVIRSGNNLDQLSIAADFEIPILSAGWGVKAHPTQALLDIYTLNEKWNGIVHGKKLLILGDVMHSRVAASHFELAKILNYEVAICGPHHFVDKAAQAAGVQVFSDLKSGLDWCDAVMALRVQNERHQDSFDMSHYSEHFGLNENTKKWIKPDCVIMHPGPINHGVEMDAVVISDSRSVILKQVTHGVYVRQALINQLLGGS